MLKGTEFAFPTTRWISLSVRGLGPVDDRPTKRMKFQEFNKVNVVIQNESIRMVDRVLRGNFS